jgi:hypothetical protein
VLDWSETPQATAGPLGIYSGSDIVEDLIVGIGSQLDGSTVVDFRFGRNGLNDHGDVTFFANLADGRQGVYVAHIPTPAGLSILMTGLVISTRRRR